MFKVVITEKGGAQRQMDFDKGEVTIGRIQGNDIILPKGNVSKKHSRIVLKDKRFIVVDLKSTNGTYVNGRKITSPLVVKAGDKIYIGDFILTLDEGMEDAASASIPAASIPAPPMPAIEAPRPPTSPTTGMASPPLGALRSAQPPPRVTTTGNHAASVQGAALPLIQLPSAPPSISPNPAASSLVPSQFGSALPPASEHGVHGQPTLGARPKKISADGPGIVEPQERFRLDEEPREESSANHAQPSARVSVRPKPKDPRNPVALVLSYASESFDVGAAVAPESATDARWRDARNAVERAVERVGKEGANAGFEQEQLVALSMAEAVGLGPLSLLLDDPSVVRIRIESPQAIQIDRGQGFVLSQTQFSSADSLSAAILRLASRTGVKQTGPIFELALPDGSDMFAAISPAVATPFLELRKAGRAVLTGASLVGAGVLSEAMWSVLERAVHERRNIVVLGPAPGHERAISPSEILSALLATAPLNQSAVIVQATQELSVESRNVVRFLASGSLSIGSLAQKAARLRYGRLVIDGMITADDVRSGLAAMLAQGQGALASIYTRVTGDVFEHLRAIGGPEHEAFRSAEIVLVLATAANGDARAAQLVEIHDGAPSTLFVLRGDNFVQLAAPSN